MAKKKTIEAPENVAPTIELTETPAAEAPVEVVPEAETEEVPAPVVEAPKAPAADLSALPAQAVEYLKRHTEVDAIYIDKFGGMFPQLIIFIMGRGVKLFC